MLKLSQPNVSADAIERVAEVLRSGHLVHGPESDAFERELAEYLGCRDVVLVSSGTAALHLALMSLDIGPGDAVLLPDFTFPATANAVMLVGARPVIVDVEAQTYNISVDALRAAVKGWSGPEALKAVIPVHEFGCPLAMARIQSIAAEYGLSIVEDAACALGATVDGMKAGAIGTIGCFSFHPRKTLTTGEGGALATGDASLAQRLRRLRSHGMERTPAGLTFTEVSSNYRLTQFQAVLGQSQLPHLDDWIARRRELANRYSRVLSTMRDAGRLALPLSVPGHSWQTFMVVLSDAIERASVVAALRERGIEAGPGAQSLSSIGLYGEASPTPIIGQMLAKQGLALPLYETLSDADVDRVCAALDEVVR